jgi:mono/diheme cytochrome c family protein/cytochrome c553
MTRALLAVTATWLLSVYVAAHEDGAPARLSETGLYARGGHEVIAADVEPFSPQYPLWTDGATKRRWVHLPKGTAIDATDPNNWIFPVGTRFWKEFAFNGRKAETRMIWRQSRDKWVFASYVWNADGTEATLAPAEGVPNAVPLTDTRAHSIPSRTDCGACHGTQRPGPLGFTALQLSPDRDPLAVHREPLDDGMVTLDTLVKEGRVRPARADWLTSPPRIATESPETRAAFGYLLANCGSCHDGRGEIAAFGPTLRVEELLCDADAVARTLVAHATKWQVPHMPEGESFLLHPDRVERSAILVRMRSRSPSSQMPPLGTLLRDAEALDRLTAWATMVATRAREGTR